MSFIFLACILLAGNAIQLSEILVSILEYILYFANRNAQTY